jgi:hypothetical protein
MKKIKILPLLILMIGLIAGTTWAQKITSHKICNPKTAGISIVYSQSVPPSIPVNISSKQSGQIKLAHKTRSKHSPRHTKNVTIRYDDGVNHDAIAANDFLMAAAYWPASTMEQYTGMKLSEVKVYIHDTATQFTLMICGQGTPISPGAMLHEQIAEVNAYSWNTIVLSQQVDISGDDLWVGYEVHHYLGDFAAGCDAGPAVAGYGDMVSFDGIYYEPISGFGLDYNWNIAAILTDDPQVSWNPQEFIFSWSPSGMDTQELEVSNTGTGILDCSMNITYGSSAPGASTSLENSRALHPKQTSRAHAIKANTPPRQTDVVFIRYDDGINFDAISAGNNFEVSAYWPEYVMQQYTGMELSEVEVYISDAPDTFELKVYGAGTPTEPGNLLYQQTVDVSPGIWNTIELLPRLEITGDDIWIGYHVTTPWNYPAGCDAGPAVAGYGDMISIDGITFEPMSNLGFNYNWNIAATLSGEIGMEWLSIDPQSASIQAGQSMVFDVTADFSNFPDYVNEYMYGSIWMTTNDPLNPLVEIPFIATPIQSAENRSGTGHLMAWPNPGNGFVNISSGYTMHKTSVCNQAGQLMLQKQLSGKSARLNTASLETGLYFLTVDSEAGTFTCKLIIR